MFGKSRQLLVTEEAAIYRKEEVGDTFNFMGVIESGQLQ